jgi:PAS domain S-box-containing protein
VRDDRGRHVGFAKVTRDTTARRAAEEALRQSEERFRLLVEQTADYAIFMLDPDGHISSWNTGAKRIKGYDADEIIGQHFSVFYKEEARASRHPEYELEVARRSGRYEEEGWRIRKDGTQFWANVVITAVHDDRGELMGFAKVTRDMTERRAASIVLEEANEHLTEAAAERTAFLAVTAHELRGPVALLRGYSELLRDGWRELDDGTRDDMIGTLVRTSDRLTRLVEDLLTATRLEAGTVVVTPVLTSLAAVAVTVVNELAPPDGPVRVDIVCPPDAVAMADGARLQQMLSNLVANALRYGDPPYEVTVEIIDGVAEIAVVDGGPGVPEALRPQLFGKFVHGSHEESNGLGLYIVRQLAEAQGGSATYEPDRSRFVVRLPAG